MSRSGQVTKVYSTSRVAYQLALIALTQVFGLSVWFSSTAVLPSLIRDWGISAPEAAWLSMATQVGFAIGAVVLSLTGMLDRFIPHQVLGISALMTALLTAIFALFVSSLQLAIAIRFLIGICFAGIYPPALKLTASWSLENRSLSFGILGGCLTLGSSLPYLLNIFPGFSWQLLVGSTALASAFAGILSLLWIRSGPFNNTGGVIGISYAWRMFREAGPRSACLGYFGHMFELYAVWTWVPIFLLHSMHQPSMTPILGVSVFFCLGVGGFTGCLLGGAMAERFGRQKVAAIALSISGACCVLSPWIFGASFEVLIIFTFVWGASVIADSGLFSAMLSSSANQQLVGTALSTQTAIGFLVTLVTIQMTPIIAEAYGWQYAFPYLAVGPALGILALTGLPAKRLFFKA